MAHCIDGLKSGILRTLIKKTKLTALSWLPCIAEFISDIKQLTHDANLNSIWPKVKQSNEVFQPSSDFIKVP